MVGSIAQFDTNSTCEYLSVWHTVKNPQMNYL